ncbi:alpha/beta hydrolase [soil metagenome]
MVVLLALMLAGCREGPPTTVESHIPASLAPRFWPPAGWTWGTLRLKSGAQVRYGVAGPSGVARAQVVLVSGHREPIEAWFETIADLTAKGLIVWAVEGNEDGAREVAGLAAKGSPGTPILLLGSADGATSAVLAAQRGVPGLAGLVLSSPTISSDKRSAPKAWSRSDPDGLAAGLTSDRWRGAVVKAWLTANPDLRPNITDADLAAEAARAKLVTAGQLPVPVLILTAIDPAGEVAGLCSALPQCTHELLAGGHADLHLEADAIRGAWLAAVLAATDAAQPADRIRE